MGFAFSKSFAGVAIQCKSNMEQTPGICSRGRAGQTPSSGVKRVRQRDRGSVGDAMSAVSTRPL